MSEWIFGYGGFRPRQTGLREALCTLGNGYFATRGAAEEAEAGDVHYPGTYLAGCYNRLETIVGDRSWSTKTWSTSNWLCLSVRLEDGPWFDLSAVEILAYQQELDLKNGLLTRRVRFRDPEAASASSAAAARAHEAPPSSRSCDGPWRRRTGPEG